MGTWIAVAVSVVECIILILVLTVLGATILKRKGMLPAELSAEIEKQVKFRETEEGQRVTRKFTQRFWGSLVALAAGILVAGWMINHW